VDGESFPYAVIDWRRRAWVSLHGFDQFWRAVARETLDQWYINERGRGNDPFVTTHDCHAPLAPDPEEFLPSGGSTGSDL
jgi:hypothetical protein